MSETHELFHSIQQLARQLTKSLNSSLQPFNIYHSEWTVLYVLKNKGPLTQREIAEYLAIEAPPVTRTIKKLVEKSYVMQVKGSDKRSNHVVLTDLALKEFPKWEQAVIQANELLIQKLPDTSYEQLKFIVTSWSDSLTFREE
ncbi:MarR family winged helix-turn-helix transcriptional regulator [Bacillus sp. B1-b2]|uniref:MarR family winged helix-turn-helix transcriptional regulator n=1 Tax=Bacillus sp. B1-b2 TaxID=2653201 RepID=UPI001261EE08|nr:MarR family transcriptional regulator [Bacillus sp. B1-b2]KAB7673188.1 MarR family transcriptional regulator [Bacillus sp. B1-b2]